MEIVLHKNPSSQAIVLTQRNITYKHPFTFIYSESRILRNKLIHLQLSLDFKIRHYNIQQLEKQKEELFPILINSKSFQVEKLADKNIKAIVCTPALIGEKTDNSNEQDGDLNKYSSIIRGLADKNKLSLVDLRKSFLDYNKQSNTENKESGILTTDRVHLNEKGNDLVAAEMWKAIKAQ